jgi:acyl-CoA synthetase (AMP-forming)/AMP-acid ligase II
MCAERICEEDCAGLNLSRWDLAFVGAEPVRAETLDRFARTFEPYGFRQEAFYPCYGLAESTLLVSGGLKHRGMTVQNVSAADLELNQFKPFSPDSGPDRKLVGCGHSLDDQQIVIVDPETLRTTTHGQVGEIWVRGPSVAAGYWNAPEASAATFEAMLADTGEGSFLRTGDLGYLHDGQLYITGRLKDLIILAGRNHYPQDIEQTAEQSHPALRCCAAFGIDLEGEEQLIVVAEVLRRPGLRTDAATRRTPDSASTDSGSRDNGSTDNGSTDVEQSPEIVRAIRQAVFEQHGARVARVQLVQAASILKTSSGKIRRQACRAEYLASCVNQVV